MLDAGYVFLDTGRWIKKVHSHNENRTGNRQGPGVLHSSTGSGQRTYFTSIIFRVEEYPPAVSV